MCVVLVALPMWPAASSLAAPSLDVAVGKTVRKVVVFGHAEGAPASARVNVRLFKIAGDGSTRLVGRRISPLERDGSYRVRFDRPRRGNCAAKVKIKGRRDTQKTKAFPCATPVFDKGTAILSDGDALVTIDTLIADDDATRSYGLMYRMRLAEDKGMIFHFPQETNAAFWMKDTLLPLSIAFFGVDGRILEILDMEPCLEEPCPFYDPGVTYRGALEVNQGAFDAWGIGVGGYVHGGG